MISKTGVNVQRKSTWPTMSAVSLFVSLFLLLAIGSTIVALSGHAIVLNESQILYLFSTSAQVIAGVYGLTLTSFTFFRNELSRQEFEDETLADAVESMKSRYFDLLKFITVLVTLTLLLANLVISHEGPGKAWLTTLLINTGQSAFLTSLLVIAYFVFDVVSPRRIELASKTLQSKYDPALAEQTKGSLEEFLTNYNKIEVLLEKAGQPYKEASPSAYDKRYSRRLSNTRLTEILLRSERIDKQLFTGLRVLITLRNSIIHGANPAVSQAIVETSRDVLQQLSNALD